MQYKFCEDGNFEDLACGRVLIHKSGYPHFPVRLAGELFGRCRSYLQNREDLTLYDPCCGSGYMLTVLGFLYGGELASIIASDVKAEAVVLAKENLSLLTREGLSERTEQIRRLGDTYHKASHSEALESAARLLSRVNKMKTPAISTFQGDVLDPATLASSNFKADIVLSDVPYGKLVAWEGESSAEIFLDNVRPVLKRGAVVALCSDKKQKFGSVGYVRLEKQIIGKRKFEIFALKD